MSAPLEDREPYPEEDDPATHADALGDGVDPEAYFQELNQFLAQTAEEATAEDDVDSPSETPEVPA